MIFFSSINQTKLWVCLLFSLTAVAYMFGFFIPLMEIDAAQYAIISKEMYLTKSYLQVFLRGNDYLDKPPMLFWLSSLSFSIFGINDVAFRLPSFIVSLGGLYAVYQICKLHYTKTIGLYAVLIAANCQAFYLMHHDVRTDTMLTGFVMLAFWQFSVFIYLKSWRALMLFSVFMACALMIKGPIALIVIAVAFGTKFLLNKEWQHIFNWKYLVSIIIIGVLLFPMSWGLYQQFDLHPEKTVYEIKSPSGLEFFYWTQSFGRITGSSTWTNNPDPIFLVHSFLWSFLPWSIIFFAAIVWYLKSNFIKWKNKILDFDLVILSGFLLIFIFLSLSKFQLPHYTFVIHPLAAIILAKYLTHFESNDKPISKSIPFILQFINMLLLILSIIVSFYVFKISTTAFILYLSIQVACYVVLYQFKKINKTLKLISIGVIGIACTNIILNAAIYPKLLEYQAFHQIAKDINEVDKNEKQGQLLLYANVTCFSTDFYLNYKMKCITSEANIDSLCKQPNSWIMLDMAHFNKLKTKYRFSKTIEYQNFSVTTIHAQFLNPNTRYQTLTPIVIAKFFH